MNVMIEQNQSEAHGLATWKAAISEGEFVVSVRILVVHFWKIYAYPLPRPDSKIGDVK